jgi:hypothetical protein
MRILLAEYVVIAIACLLEGKIPQTLYWIGAVILLIGVMMGMK